MEIWRESWFQNIAEPLSFVQDNHSKSVKGTLRGLHYQLGKPQGKYVRVIQGEVYDVAVDMRKSSDTFGQWVGQILSEENKKGFWIPPGFAHGFYVMSATAEIIYKCTEYYDAEEERCLLWNDRQLAIHWPLDKEDVLLSSRDALGCSFAESDYYN